MLGSWPGGWKGAPAACEDWQVQGMRAKPHLGETRGQGGAPLSRGPAAHTLLAFHCFKKFQPFLKENFHCPEM